MAVACAGFSRRDVAGLELEGRELDGRDFCELDGRDFCELDGRDFCSLGRDFCELDGRDLCELDGRDFGGLALWLALEIRERAEPEGRGTCELEGRDRAELEGRERAELEGRESDGSAAGSGVESLGAALVIAWWCACLEDRRLDVDRLDVGRLDVDRLDVGRLSIAFEFWLKLGLAACNHTRRGSARAEQHLLSATRARGRGFAPLHLPCNPHGRATRAGVTGHARLTRGRHAVSGTHAVRTDRQRQAGCPTPHRIGQPRRLRACARPHTPHRAWLGASTHLCSYPRGETARKPCRSVAAGQ